MLNPKGKKRKRFIRAILSGRSQKEAAIAAGYSPLSATSSGTQVMKNPEIREEIRKALEKQGLNLTYSFQELKRGLKDGKMGNHAEYLTLLLKIQKVMGNEEKSDAQTTNILAIIQDKLIQNPIDTIVTQDAEIVDNSVDKKAQ